MDVAIPRSDARSPHAQRVVRLGTPSSAADLARLRTLVRRRCVPTCRWLAAVTGAGGDVDYLVATAEPETLVWRAASGSFRRETRAVFVFASGDAAASFLDGALGATTADIELVEAPEPHVDAVATSLAAGGTPMSQLARLVVHRPAGSDVLTLTATASGDVDSDIAAIGDIAAPGDDAPRVPAHRRVLSARRTRVIAVVCTAAIAAAVPAVVVLTRQGTESPPVIQLYPPARFGAALAFDQRTGTALSFGGAGAEGETWSWQGRFWNRVQTRVAPPARVGAAIAYEPLRDRVLLFGGRTRDGAALGDTWAWDGSAWTEVGGAPAPPARAAPVMAYDTARGDVVLVTAGQTWIFDGARWAQQHPRHQPPAARAVIATDSAASRVLLVASDGGAVRTWAWYGGDWQALSSSRPPVAETPVAMAEDPIARTDVLVTQSGAQPVQTWTWAEGGWSVHGARASLASPVGVVTDSARGIVVAFVPTSQDGMVWQAWTWTSTRWLRLGPQTVSTSGPASRQMVASAFDLDRQQLVLFGGYDSRSRPLGQTLTWDGTSWTTRSTPVAPAARIAAVMAWDPVSRDILLFGGMENLDATRGLADTWTWNGTAWTELHPRSGPGDDAVALALVNDAARSRMVLVTARQPVGPGSGVIDTWTWDGVTWAPQASARRLPYPGPDAVVADAAHGDVVAVVSGFTLASHAATWRWDGSGWDELHPAAAAQVMPAALAAVADPGSRSVLLLTPAYRTSTDPTSLGGMQMWDGSSWTHLDAPLPDLDISARRTVAPYWDDALQRVVAVGNVSLGVLDQVWIWTEKAWVQVEGTR